MSFKWKVTRHASKRAIQRFGVKKEGVLNWANQKMDYAQFIAEVVDSKGKPARLFVHKGVNILADVKEDVIKTFIYPSEISGVSRRMASFARKELEQYGRKQEKSLRENERLRAEIEQELSITRSRLLRARSLPTKLACQARIKALKMRYEELPKDDHEVRRNYTRQVRAISKIL